MKTNHKNQTSKTAKRGHFGSSAVLGVMDDLSKRFESGKEQLLLSPKLLIACIGLLILTLLPCRADQCIPCSLEPAQIFCSVFEQYSESHGRIVELGTNHGTSLAEKMSAIRGGENQHINQRNQNELLGSHPSFLIPIASEFVIGSSSDKTAQNSSECQLYGLKQDLVECIHYLIVAIIAGFVASAYTRRRMTPNDPKLSHDDRESANERKQNEK
jgi:hypothetical protein